MKCIIIMGSNSDADWAKKITDKLDEYKITHEEHVASAHKQAKEALAILEKYKNEKVVYITIAGRSNALSGFVAGNSDKITIACPPFSSKEDMILNLNSTLQMPSNVPVLTVLDPNNCALAIKRIFDLQ
ncbi:MAG: AIR carboxylase family protein [Candidatus Magasanikbacteria bacterium]